MNGMTPTCRKPGRRRVASIALSVLALTGLTAVSAPHADAAPTGAKYEHDVAVYTNAQRTSRHLVKLKWNGCLDKYAEAQATRMAKRQSLQHQALLPILQRCHMNLVGENIAMGYASGHAATVAWMHSPGHRANILKKQYRLYGVGAYRDSHGTWWVSHVFGRKA
jgi:uncharacterized protein YkwD